MPSVNRSGNWFRALWLVAIAGCVAIFMGCNEPPLARLNAPPQGHTDSTHEMKVNYTYMNDNALLAERSMSPVHFIPESTELNGSGIRRLNRLAELLKLYGGGIRYDGVDEEVDLAARRVDEIKNHLVSAGVQPDKFTVETGLAGGTGMRATEDTEIRKAGSASVPGIQAAQLRVIEEKK